jgi:predicted SnoaL-like aldol condensation-catalyzing enzyme
VDTQRNKATLQRLYDEVMNGHDVNAADALITLDRPDHDPTFPPELTTGREGFKKLFGMLIAAFPDLHFTTQSWSRRTTWFSPSPRSKVRIVVSSWASRQRRSRSL